MAREREGRKGYYVRIHSTRRFYSSLIIYVVLLRETGHYFT